MTSQHRWFTLLLVGALLVPAVARAQDTISGRFYRYQGVGRTGLGEMTGVLAGGPSINDLGQVAFAGQASPLNAVFVSDLGGGATRKIAQQNAFSFLGGIKINGSSWK